MRNKYLPLVVLISAFLAIRMLILFSGVDGLIYDLAANLGTISKVLIDGVSPTFIFRYFENWRWGSVVGGILAVPFFRIFGERLVVLQAVAMLFSFGILILMYLFLNKFFNRRVAILGSLLFILPPPNYIKMSFILCGGYGEINFFFMLAIFLFYKIFFGGGTDRMYLYAFFGTVCGFALFYDYTFLLTLGCCLLFWFNFDKGIFAKKNFYIFALCFLIGYSPWFYYNATHNWNGIFIMRREPLSIWFIKNGFLGSLIQLKNLVAFVIPGFFNFKDFFFLSKKFISYIYYFIFVFSFIGLLWLHRKSIAQFFLSLVPSRRFNTPRGMISPETPLIIYVIIFLLAHSFCGISYLFPSDADLVFPYRYVIFVMPALFMVASIFLVRIAQYNRYGLFVSRISICALIAIGLIGNIGMITWQDYRVSILPEGYNYVYYGKELRWAGANIEGISGEIQKIDKKYRRFFYDGYRWAVPEGYDGYQWGASGKRGRFSLKGHVQKKITAHIDKNYWPLAYEHLGMAMGHRRRRYSKSDDDEFKSHVEQAYHPYFYRGLGRSCVNKEFSRHKYNHLLGIVDKQYWRHFHEGMGIEMDVMLIEDTKKFTQFMSTLDTEAQKDIYSGLARGREYPRISYRKFQPGFGKILPSIREWERVIINIEEEFRPYCYQRLGVEIGWRFIYVMRGYLNFLQKADEKYKPYMYKGVGMAIGWRFGYDIKGCVLLINKIEPGYRVYLYEGLGVGVARRYSYPLDELTRESEVEKVPAEYRGQFRKGLAQEYTFA